MSSNVVLQPPLLQISGNTDTAVSLHSADVGIEVSGAFATTTMLLEVRNPSSRVLEGALQFPLSGSQQRIYPIPAHGSRQVRLVIEEAMPLDSGAWRLAVPVQLLSGAHAFSLRVRANGVASAPRVEGSAGAMPFSRDAQGYQATVRRTAFRPQRGLTLRFPASTRPMTYGGDHDGEHFVLAEIPVPQADASRKTLPSSVGLLWDASASARKRDRDGEFALLGRYFKAMGNGRAHLRVLRDVGEDGGTFEIRNGDWARLRRTLETTVNDGASNLSDWTPNPRISEYLLVSGGRLVAWQGRRTLDAAVLALLGRGTRIVQMRGEGVTDLQAETRHVAAGLLRIAGRLTERTGVIRATLDESGRRRDITLPVSSAADGAHVPRQWAKWQIAAYAGESERHRAAIARLGQQFSVVTAGTSLLVLDDIADYMRYDIAPTAELRVDVARLQAERGKQREASRSERVDAAANAFAERLAWWNTTFSKNPPPSQKAIQKSESDATTLDSVAVTGNSMSRPAAMAQTPPPLQAPAAESRASQDGAGTLERVALLSPGSFGMRRCCPTSRNWTSTTATCCACLACIRR